MSQLEQMQRGADALYHAEQAKLRDITEEESRLRHALVQLEEKRRAARALPADQMNAPRAIGADMLWQGWTQRTRADLNVALAQVLVRKAEKMGALRLAFGRAEAVRTLLTNEKTARRKMAQDREERRSQDLALLKGRYTS